MSHFTVDVRYLTKEESYTSGVGTEEARRLAPQRRREQRAKLKELGFKTPYFQFRNVDEKGKAAARAKAEAFHKEWSAKAGFELDICEGCFL